MHELSPLARPQFKTFKLSSPTRSDLMHHLTRLEGASKPNGVQKVQRYHEFWGRIERAQHKAGPEAKSPFEIAKQYVDDLIKEGLSEGQAHDVLNEIVAEAHRKGNKLDAAYFTAMEEAINDNNHDPLGELIRTVKERGKQDEFFAMMEHYFFLVLFTSHPNIFKTRSQAKAVDTMVAGLRGNDEAIVRRGVRDNQNATLKYSRPPTVREEAGWILDRAAVLYDLIPEMIETMRAEFPEPQYAGKLDHLTDVLRAGSWAGWDRDGHPKVTNKVTVAVAEDLKRYTIDRYLEDLEAMQTEHGQSDILSGIIAKLRREQEHHVDHANLQKRADEPYPLEAFQADLQRYVDSLESREREQAAAARFLRKTKMHRYQLLRGIPRDEADAFVGVRDGIAGLERDDKKALTPAAREKLTPAQREIVDIFPTLKAIQEVNGKDAVYSYTISNTEEADHLLAVFDLAEASGTSIEDLDIHVIPLFESAESIPKAVEVLEKLWADQRFRDYVIRKGEFVVKLGYSDGTKTSGAWAAITETFQARMKMQENPHIRAIAEWIEKISEEAGKPIRGIIYDGASPVYVRGGDPGSGTGYTLLSPVAQSGIIRTLFQGGAIDIFAATPKIMRAHIAGYFTAAPLTQMLGLQNYSLEEGKKADFANFVSDSAKATYGEMYNSKEFNEFLWGYTTLPFVGEFCNGSRPVTAGRKVRAIPFSVALNESAGIPFSALYGTAQALRAGMAEHGVDIATLKGWYENDPFFEYQFRYIRQAMEKYTLWLNEHIARSEEHPQHKIWKDIYDSVKDLEKILIEVTGWTGPSESSQMRNDLAKPV